MHHILPPSMPTNPIKLAKTHTHMPSIIPDPICPINISAAFHSLIFQDYAHSTQHAPIVPYAPSLPLLSSQNKPHSFLPSTLCYTKLAG